MIYTVARLVAWVVGAMLIALSLAGMWSQSEQQQREQERARNVRPAIGPIVQPAPHHTSQLATVSTGCVADHYIMD